MNALAKKLYVKPGSSWLIYNAPPAYTELLEPLPDGVTLKYDTSGDFDGIQLFVKNSAELAASLQIIHPLLKNDAYLWIIYPKKTSGIPTDLEMMGSWDAPGQFGLRPVASAAIDAQWTALRFRDEQLVKKSDSSKAAIAQSGNDYSAYIDPDKKQVTLPPDVAEALANTPEAYNRFEPLAYSHKKEYVIWILSAKQEKTRLSRTEKMVEMLLAGKKNPSDK